MLDGSNDSSPGQQCECSVPIKREQTDSKDWFQNELKHNPLPGSVIKAEVVPKAEVFSCDTCNEAVSHVCECVKSEFSVKVKSEAQEATTTVNNVTADVGGDRSDNVATDISSVASASRIDAPSEKRYDCETIDWSFTKKDNLKRHNIMTVHSKDRPFVCATCNGAFPTKLYLKRHMIIHEKFACLQCPRVFNAKSSLTTHLRTFTHMEAMDKKTFSCDICNRKYKTKDGLVIHSRLHTGERPYVCDVCDRAFAASSSFIGHKKTHDTNRTKPFSCTVCDRSFFVKSALKRHTRIHNGEKQFSCTVCDSTYIDKCALKQHMMIHSGEKPFSCSVCNRSFVQKCTLVRHSRVHTGEKPFVCRVCNVAFSWSTSLKIHMKSHTYL